MLVFNHTKKRLLTPRITKQYNQKNFWKLMHKARAECINDNIPYRVTQIEGKSNEDNRTTTKPDKINKSKSTKK